MGDLPSLRDRLYESYASQHSGTGSAASSYTVNGGTFTLEGIFVSTSDCVYAQTGGKVQLAVLQQDVHQNGVTLYVYDSTSSIEIGWPWKAAFGFCSALKRSSTASFAICSGVVPYSCMWRR